VDWGTFYPDGFGGWYQQPGNLPIKFVFAARAAQTNAMLDLFIGQGGQRMAARIQFTPQGNIVAITNGGTKPLASYAADAWYRFEIGLRTAEPLWWANVFDAKGTTIAAVTNLPWPTSRSRTACSSASVSVRRTEVSCSWTISAFRRSNQSKSTVATQAGHLSEGSQMKTLVSMILLPTAIASAAGLEWNSADQNFLPQGWKCGGTGTASSSRLSPTRNILS